MIPYGKNRKFRFNYRDSHPKKKGKHMRNWWEVELGGVNKGSERQKSKKNLITEINTDYIYECGDCEFMWTSPFDDREECLKCESRNIKNIEEV